MLLKSLRRAALPRRLSSRRWFRPLLRCLAAALTGAALSGAAVMELPVPLLPAYLCALTFGPEAVAAYLGAAAGYVRGVFENLIMRVCDIFSSIPSVLMAIAVVSALGKSTFNLMLAVGIASTAPFIRVARAAVLTVRGEEYVESARAIGSPEWKIVAFHILPNCVSQIIVQATLRVGSAIISAAPLSFLGLGVAQAVHQIAPGVKVDHHAAQVKHDTFIHTSCLALFRVVGEQLQYTTTRRCFSTAFCMDTARAA